MKKSLNDKTDSYAFTFKYVSHSSFQGCTIETEWNDQIKDFE